MRQESEITGEFTQAKAALQRIASALRPRRRGFDPELLFVQCRRCGRALHWEEGETSRVLAKSGVALDQLDLSMLILSDGCEACAPEELTHHADLVRPREGFFLSDDPRHGAAGRA